jgi:hypothetical protein
VRPAVGANPGYLRLPALAAPEEHLELKSVSARSLGIASMYPETLATLPSLSRRLVDPRPRLPGAARLATSLLTAPTHRMLSDADLRALERFLGH